MSDLRAIQDPMELRARARELTVQRDPRRVPELQALALDRAAPLAQRGSAMDVLTESGLVDAEAEWVLALADREPWFERYAPVTRMPRYFALLESGTWDVEDWVSTPSDGFVPDDSRVWDRCAVSSEPARRRWAMQELMWNEPHRLLPMAAAAVDDPDLGVAEEACHALAYYGGVTAAVALTRGAARGLDNAEFNLPDVLEDLYRVSVLADGRLDGWLAPVADQLVAGAEDEPWGPELGPHPQMDVEPLWELVNDPESSGPERDEALAGLAWMWQVPKADRGLWLTALVEHVDPLMRRVAVDCADRWGQDDILVALLNDPSAIVRQGATWTLGSLPATPALASVLWEQVLHPYAFGSGLSEAIASWAHHAVPDEERRERLLHLRSGRSSAGRREALRLLGESGSLEGVEPCWFPRPMDDVQEVRTWLEAIRAVGEPATVPPETRALDSVRIQETLVRGADEGLWRV